MTYQYQPTLTAAIKIQTHADLPTSRRPSSFTIDGDRLLCLNGQRAAVLQKLTTNPMECASPLQIHSRVAELRKMGIAIATVWGKRVEAGHERRFGVYVLESDVELHQGAQT